MKNDFSVSFCHAEAVVLELVYMVALLYACEHELEIFGALIISDVHTLFYLCLRMSHGDILHCSNQS